MIVLTTRNRVPERSEARSPRRGRGRWHAARRTRGELPRSAAADARHRHQLAACRQAATKKFRDARRRRKVAVVVDDRGPRFIEGRGDAETYTAGGEDVGERLVAPFRSSPSSDPSRTPTPHRRARASRVPPSNGLSGRVTRAPRSLEHTSNERPARMSAMSDASPRGWAQLAYREPASATAGNWPGNPVRRPRRSVRPRRLCAPRGGGGRRIQRRSRAGLDGDGQTPGPDPAGSTATSSFR